MVTLAKTPGWSGPYENGAMRFVAVGDLCCLSTNPPKLEGYDVRFVACISGQHITWTYVPTKKVPA